MTMKTLLLTGASGFIGKNISLYFSKKFRLLTPSHQQLDLLDAKAVSDYVKKNKVDYIIHTANIGGSQNQTNTKNIIDINLRMFFNIIHNIDLVERIIYFGSGAEYDKRKPIVSVKEEKFGQNIPGDDYGFYKYICSQYTQRLNSKKLICLRLFGVYGPHENYLIRFISNAIVKNLLHLKIKINQNVNFDYLYVNDLNLVLNYFLHHNPKHYIYNVCSGTKTSLLDIANKINQLSNYHSKITIINKGLNKEYTASNSRLINEVKNLKITTIEQGIKTLLDWYNENLDLLNKKEIINDKYANLCVVKK